MPQLDFATYPGQILWLLIAFGLQYFVLAKLILPPLRAILSKRSKHIESQLQLAESYTARAESIHLNYEERIAEAKKKSAAMISAASAEIHGAAEKELAKLDKKYSAELRARENRSKQRTQANNAEIDGLVEELSVELVKKMSGSTRIDKAKLLQHARSLHSQQTDSL